MGTNSGGVETKNQFVFSMSYTFVHVALGTFVGIDPILDEKLDDRMMPRDSSYPIINSTIN